VGAESGGENLKSQSGLKHKGESVRVVETVTNPCQDGEAPNNDASPGNVLCMLPGPISKLSSVTIPAGVVLEINERLSPGFLQAS